MDLDMVKTILREAIIQRKLRTWCMFGHWNWTTVCMDFVEGRKASVKKDVELDNLRSIQSLINHSFLLYSPSPTVTGLIDQLFQQMCFP